MRRYLFLSTERETISFAGEIREGIQSLGCYDPSVNYQLRSVSLRTSEEDKENVYNAEIHECIYEADYDINNLQHISITDPALENEFIVNDFYKLSGYLHEFADSCCSDMCDTICILWCAEKYIPCPSEVVEFYAALLKLTSWHNAGLNVITTNSDIIEDWKQLLPIHVSPSSSQVIKDDLSSFWRGSLAFSVEGTNGHLLYPQVTLSSEHQSFNPFQAVEKKQIVNHAYVLPYCEVFSEVALSSVSWPFIRKGSLCKLQISPYITEKQKEDMVSLFKTFSSRRGIGTLIRIRYSSQPPNLDGLESVTTEVWKQTMGEGNFDARPLYRFIGHHECLVMVVLSDWSTEDMLYCVALQDPCSHIEDIVQLILNESLKDECDLKDGKEKVLDLLKNTSEISEIQMAAFNYLLLNLPQMVNGILNKNGKNIALNEQTKLAIERVASNQIRDIVFSNCSCFKITSDYRMIPAELTVGKESWPEYRALEQAEKCAKLSCNSRINDLLTGLPSSKSSDALKINASQLFKYFKSGDSKDLILQKKFTIGPPSCNLVKSALRVDEVKKIPWPEACHIRHHGIYYNCGSEQEKLEFLCNSYRDRFIQDDVSSTCSVFPSEENRKVSSWIELKKGSAKKDSLKIVKRCHPNPTPDSDVRSIRSYASRFSSPRKSLHKTTIEAEQNLKPSDILKPLLVEQRQTRKQALKPSDLSDLHKRKLRNVILASLEGEGIGVKHKMFKLCFKKLFAVCKPFALDVIGRGSTTRNFAQIASAHVKQVIQFEKQKKS